MTVAPGVDWRWSRFDALAPRDVYDALALRSAVFVVEQGCAFQDADGLDAAAWHLLGRTADGTLAAYLRCLDAGAKYDEPSIGRVIVDLRWRNTGLGRALMAEGIARSRAAWPGRAIRIGAQHRLERFYASLGFAVAGPVYVEDGIDHVEMVGAWHDRTETRSDHP